MSRIWYTSDLHIGHRPVEEFLLHRADRIEKEVRRG